MKFWRSVAIGSWVCVLLLAGCSYPPNKPVYGGTSGEPNQVISSSTYSSPNSAYQPPPTYSGPAPAAVSTPQSPNDAMVVQRVNQALRSSTFGVSPDSISVSAQNGTITLNGIVPSEQQRQMIDDLVRNTSGVINVNNQLQLGSSPSTVYHQASSPYPRPPSAAPATATTGDIFNLHVQGLNEADRELAQRILQGLRTDSRLGALLPTVNITVAQGRVILQGVVQNEQQRSAIESVIRQATGGSNIENQLQIQSTAVPLAQ